MALGHNEFYAKVSRHWDGLTVTRTLAPHPLPAPALDPHGGANVAVIPLSSICWAGLFVPGY